MGSDPAARARARPRRGARPPGRRAPRFRIGRTPVTNAEYRLFVDATSRRAPSHWPGGTHPRGPRAPSGHLRLLGRRGRVLPLGGRVPAERGAVGAGGPRRRRPRCGRGATSRRRRSTRSSPCATRRRSGSCPDGASPFGVLDLAGNAWEWTASALRPYPYVAGDGREDGASPEPRVVRGGSFIHGAGEIRCSYRHGMLPGAVDHYVGFRLAADAGRRLRARRRRWSTCPRARCCSGTTRARPAGPRRPTRRRGTTVVVEAVVALDDAVTNAQYGAFVDATGHPAPPHWPGGAMPEELARAPGHATSTGTTRPPSAAGPAARLPTEAEWEKARARHRRPPLPVGRRRAAGRVAARHVGGGAKHGRTTPVGGAPGRRQPVRSPRHGRQRLGVGEQRLRAVPVRRRTTGGRIRAPACARVLRGGSYASPTARNLRCAAPSRSAPGPPLAAHRLPDAAIGPRRRDVTGPLPHVRRAPRRPPLGAPGAAQPRGRGRRPAARGAHPAILVTDGREITRTVTFGELSAELEPARERPLGARASRRATGSRSCSRSAPETAIAHIAAYKLGAIAVPLSTAFGPDALEVRLRGSSRESLLGERDSLERARALGFDGVTDRRRPRPRRPARGRLARVRRRSDDARHARPARLHVRHDRPAEGRAPRPPRPRRPPARVRALARLLPAARRPDLDARRLGLDRRALRRSDARPRPRHARSSRSARRGSTPSRPST